MISSKTNIYDAKWVDMVFEDRNKEYGAFELRKKSSHYTMLAIIFAILFFGLTISAPIIINYIKGFVPEASEPLKITEVNTLEEPPPLDEQEPPPLEVPPPPPLKSTIQYTPPVVVPEEEIDDDDTPPIQEEVNNQAVSTQTTEGDSNGIDPSLLNNNNTGIVGGTEEAALDYAEQMPEFPGGETAMLKFIYDNLQYPPLAKENGIQGRVTVTFIVNKDGHISDVKASNKKVLGWGCEEEVVRVVKMLPKWRPGKQNGFPVRVKMAIPVVFKIN